MIEMIILSVVGIFLLVCAILIGGFGTIELLHSYHYTNVSDGDTKAYTHSMGGVLFLFALSCFSAVAVHAFTESAWWAVILLVGFVVSIFLLWYVQKKYNGGMIG